MDPRDLVATQSELDGVKVAGILRGLDESQAGRTTIVVSRDNSVLDGHHRWAAWAAFAEDHPSTRINVMRVDAPIRQLMDYGQHYDDTHGIEHKAFGQK